MSDENNNDQEAEIEEQQIEVEEQQAEHEEKKSFPILAIVVVISLILAIIAAAGVGVSWFKSEQQLVNQSQSIKAIDNKVDALQQSQQLNKNVTEATQTSLNKQQQVISKQLDQITEQLGRNRYDWSVSEIRYTLRQANMRLQLFKDKTTALVALRLADAQLAKLADPALFKLRGVVNKEIAALNAVEEIDLEGVSLRLTALTEQINNIEVSITKRTEKSSPENIPAVEDVGDWAQWKKHADAIWTELKTLVTIRRTDKKILPLLSEQESQQLREALSLKIEIARLALLQQNTSLFHSSLKAASDWLEKYFNAEQPVVIAITAELKSLMSLQLEPGYPDISRSLAMLEQSQQTIVAKEKPAPVVEEVEKKPKEKTELKTEAKTESKAGAATKTEPEPKEASASKAKPAQ